MTAKRIPLGDCSCGAALTTIVDYASGWVRYQHGANPECVIQLDADDLITRTLHANTQPVVNQVAAWIFALHTREMANA